MVISWHKSHSPRLALPSGISLDEICLNTKPQLVEAQSHTDRDMANFFALINLCQL